VHLAHLRLRNFRNYTRLEVDFAPGGHVLLGANAQGKTNLLEAVYLLATLRSFRGAANPQLVRHGQRGYFVGGQVVGQNASEIKLYWSATERKLSVNGQPVRRLADYFGLWRAVVFCTDDLQLVKGSASRRRRFLDLLLCQTHPTYLPQLLRYLYAVRARNALLKNSMIDEDALAGFSQEMVAAGEPLIRLRRELAPLLSPLVRAAYQRMASEAEEVYLDYRPSAEGDLAVALAQSRNRERNQHTTVVGPHRDDLLLLLDGQPVAAFGSEGQKRTLAVALKMAQADYLTELHGSPPVLLIDDVMGELDRRRRSGLLPMLERSQQSRGQLFLTCTEETWPRELGRQLTRWQVHAGALTRLPD
jgi:DNA replication and repair protein RecF